MERELIVATCQFPVSADIGRNRSYILKQMAAAKSQGAEVAHFSESSLSGYAGMDFESYESQDGACLHSSLEKDQCLLAELLPSRREDFLPDREQFGVRPVNLFPFHLYLILASPIQVLLLHKVWVVDRDRRHNLDR